MVTLFAILCLALNVICLQQVVIEWKRFKRSSDESLVDGLTLEVMSSKSQIRAESLAAKKRLIDSNPCHYEQTKSLNCIQINSNDSDKCEREFDNYRMCKTFWYEITKFRKINDIKPSLPEPEERRRMKEIYLKTGSLKPIKDQMKKDYNL